MIADPELTVGLPPKITARTGMDALSHYLEAYCAPVLPPDGRRHRGRGHAAHQGVAAEARAGRQEHRGARHMLAAAAMGATAFQKGLGAMHALAHPVGAIYDTHHGLTNGVLMPYVLDFNRTAIDEKLVALLLICEFPMASMAS